MILDEIRVIYRTRNKVCTRIYNKVHRVAMSSIIIFIIICKVYNEQNMEKITTKNICDNGEEQ